MIHTKYFNFENICKNRLKIMYGLIRLLCTPRIQGENPSEPRNQYASGKEL